MRELNASGRVARTILYTVFSFLAALHLSLFFGDYLPGAALCFTLLAVKE